MTVRRVVGWTGFGLTISCVAVAASLPDRNFPLRAILFLAVGPLLAAVCGVLVALKRPNIAIGWIRLIIALYLASGVAATQHPLHWVGHSGARPRRVVA